jgi:undecaprenyl pyrophosphate phosphatase UppP
MGAEPSRVVCTVQARAVLHQKPGTHSPGATFTLSLVQGVGFCAGAQWSFLLEVPPLNEMCACSEVKHCREQGWGVPTSTDSREGPLDCGNTQLRL